MKTVSRVSKPRSTAPVAISWSTGVLRLRDEDLFGERLGELCVVFLRRIFALSEVKSVEIDREKFTAEIHFDNGPLKLAEHLQRLAGAIRGQTSEHSQAISDCPVLEDLFRSRGRIKIRRLDTILTTWDIVDHQPGRIRLRHESIRLDPVLARRLQNVAEHAAGVTYCSVQPLTGSVLIRFDPAATSASRLFRFSSESAEDQHFRTLTIRIP